MKSFLAVYAALGLICTSSHAANTCKKDACYNAVAVQNANSPNLASRKSACSSILKTVVDSDVTATSVVFSTAPPVTSTITLTSTSIKVVTTRTTFVPGKRSVVEVGVKPAALEVRDKVVIKGSKPAFATACKTNTDFAVACLCFGIKAGAQQTITKTIAITQIIYRTVLTTTSTTTTTDATSLIPRPTSCSAAQREYCGNCACLIATESWNGDRSKPFCVNTRVCSDCQTTTCCAYVFEDLMYFPVFDGPNRQYCNAAAPEKTQLCVRVDNCPRFP